MESSKIKVIADNGFTKHFLGCKITEDGGNIIIWENADKLYARKIVAIVPSTCIVYFEDAVIT